MYIDGDATGVATVTLENVQVENNTAANPTYTPARAAADTTEDRAQARNGGGIASFGVLNFTTGTLRNNTAQNDGGGMYAFNATTTIDTVDVSGNTVLYRKGGGFYNYGGILTIRNSELYENQALNTPFGYEAAYPVLDNFAFPAGGVAPNPSNPTILNSNNWSMQLRSNLVSNFGATQTAAQVAVDEALSSNDRLFARGYSPGNVYRGGVYGFVVDEAGTNTILGMQPNNGAPAQDDALTFGSMRLRVENTTGAPVTSYTVNYDIWTLNNGACSSQFNFQYSTQTTSSASGQPTHSTLQVV
ncbi:MAG: hypothetical protein HC876_17905 [Chloroflexaceae bacterium]|nr:hypothetical protein [Chloroflexaceae bacterium]